MPAATTQTVHPLLTDAVIEAAAQRLALDHVTANGVAEYYDWNLTDAIWKTGFRRQAQRILEAAFVAIPAETVYVNLMAPADGSDPTARHSVNGFVHRDREEADAVRSEWDGAIRPVSTHAAALVILEKVSN